MKTSQATIALCLCMTAFASTSSAQSPPASTDAVELEVLTEKARQHFFEGVGAMKKGQWVEAHAAFLAAWRIRPHYSIASNLGASEIKLGRFRDAAEHLSFYLREVPKTKDKERQRAQAVLDEALTKVASVTLRGLPDGAEVKVDGAPIGRAPLAGPVFLDPGAHAFEAKMDGFPAASASLDVRAGEVRDVALVLKKDVPPPPPVPIVPRRRSVVPGVVMGAAGGAAVIVGVGLIAGSRSKVSSASNLHDTVAAGVIGCPSDPRCSQLASTSTSADALQNVGVGVLIGAGIVGAAAVGYLLWPKPSGADKPAVTLRPVPSVSSNSGGVLLLGTF